VPATLERALLDEAATRNARAPPPLRAADRRERRKTSSATVIVFTTIGRAISAGSATPFRRMRYHAAGVGDQRHHHTHQRRSTMTRLSSAMAALVLGAFTAGSH
jgi:hypothetical protein